MDNLATIDNIETALNFIPANDRDTCINMGMAIKSELGESSYDSWDKWLQTGDNYNKKDMLAVWKSINAIGGITVATLFHEAKPYGFEFAKDTPKLTQSEIDKRNIERQAREIEAKKQQAIKYAEAATRCNESWDKAQPASDEHPYLKDKQVKAHSLKQDADGNLLVPVRINRLITSIQTIHSNGDKRFHFGGEIKSGYHVIGKATNVVLVGEGFATMAAAFEATTYCSVVAFNAGNLSPVAKIIREKFPQATIVIIADNDQWTEGNPGIRKAKAAAQAINAHVAIPEFKDASTKPTDMNDLFILEGSEVVKQQIEKSLSVNSEQQTERLPRGFKLKKGGLYYADPEDDEPKDIWVSSELHITGKTTDDQNGDWGKVVEFNDPDGHKHKMVIPLEVFSGDGAEARRILLGQGLLISTSAKSRALLSQYIQQAGTESKAIRCVKKTGWFESSYVLPDQVIGHNKNVILQNNTGDYSGYGVNGTIEQWQDGIAKYCIGNSRLAFSVSVAFAPPLLNLINMESGGFHYRGGSSLGKTTALYVSNSVCFNEQGLKRWRTTSNGLEGTAEVHNDTLLSLDEIGELNSREAGAVSYMLANGQGKGRSNRNGDARKSKTWRLMFNSTGEISLSQHIADGGGIVRAGHEVRVLDILADTGKYGIFENLHGFSCGSTFSSHLVNNAKTYYGIASREYLERLVTEKDNVIESIYKFKSGFIEQLKINDANGQVKRAADRFSLVAFAGELATDWGITGWHAGEATKAAKICFESWLDNRGGEQSQESMQALKKVKSFIESHGESRFTKWGDCGQSKTINRVGYSKFENDEWTYYFFLESFKNEVCKGIDYKVVLEALKKHNVLIHETDRTTSKVRAPKGKPTRFYIIKLGELDNV